MVKIVGKTFILFFLCVHTLIYSKISMEIRKNGINPHQVVIGQPLIVDVIIDDVYGSVSEPTIKGLEKFNAKRIGMYMSSVNGKSTTRYSYQVRIDTLGTFILGPALLLYQQQEFISNQIEVTVIKDAGMGSASKNNSAAHNESKAFLRLMIDKESVFMGQKIGCTLRFYYQDTSLSLNNVNIPEFSGFEVQEISKLENGIADINGSSYRYAQWRWDMYPTKAGEYIIPAYSADYEIPLKDNHGLSGLLLFVSRVDRKRVYSNAVTVNVIPLPPSNVKVQSVGVFERFSASINPSVIKEGEAMILTLELEGTGNLSAIETPLLSNMPKDLKYYDSKSTIIEPQYNDELPKKRFEYIVQGLKKGEYHIPEQSFTYFDVDKREYVTLTSCMLLVSIMPNPMNAEYKKDVSMNTDKEISPQEDVLYFNVVGDWYSIDSAKSLPNWLLLLSIGIILCYLLYPLFISSFYFFFVIIKSKYPSLMKIYLFNHAHKKIRYCKDNNKPEELYAVFTQLSKELNTCYKIRAIEDKLDEEEKMRWREFVNLLTQSAYTPQNTNYDNLPIMAEKWLKLLKRITS